MMPTGGIRSRALWRGRIRVSTPCMPRFHVLSSQSRIPFQPSSTLLGRLPHSSHCCYPRPPTPTTGPKTQEIHSWLHSRLAPPTPSFKSPLSKVPRSKFFSFCEISARGTPDRALTTSGSLFPRARHPREPEETTDMTVMNANFCAAVAALGLLVRTNGCIGTRQL